jgi:hypothetical protein
MSLVLHLRIARLLKLLGGAVAVCLAWLLVLPVLDSLGLPSRNAGIMLDCFGATLTLAVVGSLGAASVILVGYLWNRWVAAQCPQCRRVGLYALNWCNTAYCCVLCRFMIPQTPETPTDADGTLR